MCCFCALPLDPGKGEEWWILQFRASHQNRQRPGVGDLPSGFGRSAAMFPGFSPRPQDEAGKPPTGRPVPARILGSAERAAEAARPVRPNRSKDLRHAFSDPQTDVVPGETRDCNVRSKNQCSMCPAIHTKSRSWLRSSSTREPSDPLLRVVSFCRQPHGSLICVRVKYHDTSLREEPGIGLFTVRCSRAGTTSERRSESPRDSLL